MTILVFIEQRDGKVRSVAREALGEAKRLAATLGGPVVGVSCGASADGLASLGEAGAEKVLAATHEAFARYEGAGYAAAVAAAAKSTGAKLVLFGASSIGKDLAPRVAARLGVGLAADCTSLDAAGGKLVARRPVMAGKAFERVAFPATPAMVTRFPVAGTPWKGPRWVPVMVQRLETRSPSSRALSMLMRASGSALVNMVMKPDQPSLSSGWGAPDMWAT